jgi:hypothetical protein
MAPDHDQRSESPPWELPPFADIQMQIGRLLGLQYELSEELPERLLTLLKQATGQEESN